MKIKKETVLMSIITFATLPGVLFPCTAHSFLVALVALVLEAGAFLVGVLRDGDILALLLPLADFFAGDRPRNVERLLVAGIFYPVQIVYRRDYGKCVLIL